MHKKSVKTNVHKNKGLTKTSPNLNKFPAWKEEVAGAFPGACVSVLLPPRNHDMMKYMIIIRNITPDIISQVVC